MSTALIYLILLAPPAAVVWIVWSYRRKTGDKEARSREREAALVGLVQTAGKAPRSAPAERVAGGPVSPVPAAPAAAAIKQRERFLAPSETLVYYLLRNGMPGYEVFPRVDLAAVVIGARGAPVRAAGNTPTGGHDLDFVVCDKNMRVIAAVQLKGRLAEPESARLAQSLAAAGVKLVTLDPAALPKRDQLGALILGPSG